MSFRSLFPLVAAGALLIAPGSGFAEKINFDEIPAMDDPTMVVDEQYADLGVHFVMAGAIWSGRSEGDMGGWGLEGTSGPSFLGIDAPVFNMVMRFDWPVSALSFDFARSGPGASGTMMAFGYLNGAFVEMVSMDLPEMADDWRTIEMTQDVDIVVCIQIGSVPFGVDRLQWVGPLGDGPESIDVAIDIKPDSDRNPVQIGGQGVMPVLLLGSADFMVEDVDPATLYFGPGEALMAHAHGPHMGDENGDGYMDMLMHMPVPESAIGENDVEACLMGETFDGMMFVGCDLVTPVGHGGGKAKKR